MKDETFIFLTIPLFIGINLMGACGSCEKPNTPVPEPEPVPTATSSPEPCAPTPESVKPPKPSWERVEALERLIGRWGEEPGPWAEMSEQTPDGTLYPWYLSFGDGQTEPYDCGVFERINEPDGWRVAYCKGGVIGPKRRAERLVVETMTAPEGVKLRVQLQGRYELRLVGAPDEYLLP